MAMDRSSRPMHRGRKKVCSFCVDRVEHIDYKDLPRLRKYVSERAKIIPRRVTGTCAFHQRELTVAIKRARYMALMPYVSDSFARLVFTSTKNPSSPFRRAARFLFINDMAACMGRCQHPPLQNVYTKLNREPHECAAPLLRIA